MTEAVLTAERILVAAEDVLRCHGPAKANVVYVARRSDPSIDTAYGSVRALVLSGLGRKRSRRGTVPRAR